MLDNRGVGGSTGRWPTTSPTWARDAVAFTDLATRDAQLAAITAWGTRTRRS
jgi:hypothetical protein